MFYRRARLLTILVVVCLAAPVLACNIPVFRYALERWKSDATKIVIFHRGESKEIQKWRQWKPGSHLAVTTIDVSDAQKDSQDRALWSELEPLPDSSLPFAVLRCKAGNGKQLNFWQGSLQELEAFPLVDSPVRRELRRRLLAGHSVVWLLVRSRDENRNEAAKEQLEKEFETLAQNIPIPEGIGLPGSELYADIPLVVKFSLLEVDPEDPQEEYLRSLITGIRRSDYEAGQPLVVPIFGRGRALEVLPAGDLSPALIRDLTLFLSGACSCQVKDQNPGFDLAITGDWDSELFGSDENLPPDRSAEEGKNRGPVLVPIAPGR